jgi:stage II sporulation protein M
MEALGENHSTEKKAITEFIRISKFALQDARHYIIAAVVLFIAGVLAGFMQSDYFTLSVSHFEVLAGFLKNQNAVLVIIFLLLKNALACFIVLWTGVLLGIVSMFAAVQNGILMGAILSRQESVLLAFLSILPHGIFELPAFFTACGVGLWRGMWLFRRYKHETYKERARKGYLVFFRMILPLLGIAAVIEGILIAVISGP